MSSVALSAYSRPLMSHSVDRAAHETRRRMCRADAFEVDQPPAHDAVDFAVRAAPICTAHTLSGHCGSRRRGRTAAGGGSERLPLAGAGDEKISVPPKQPYLLDGREEKCCREAKENEAVDRPNRAKQPPAVLEIDIGVTEASDRFERIEHRWRPGRQSAKPEEENRPGRRFYRRWITRRPRLSDVHIRPDITRRARLTYCDNSDLRRLPACTR